MMRAAVLRGGHLRIDEQPDPVPARGQVLVETRTCGICGTDLHARHHLETFLAGLARSGSALPTDPRRDIVMGHEFCAEILDYGPDTKRLIPKGALVVGLPYVTGPMGHEYVGYSNNYPGGFAERMVLTEKLLFAVPSGLTAAHAALTEPFAVGEHAIVRSRLPEKAVVLIIGCGPIGLAVLAALKARGVGPVIATDYSPARRALAESMGADEVVDAATCTQTEIWSRFSISREQRPVAFECVGRPGVAQQVIDGLPRGGLIVVVGNVLEPSTIDQVVAFNKEIDICFSMNYTPAEFKATLDNIAEDRINASAVLTGTVPLDKLNDAFDELSNADSHAKIMVSFG